MAHLGESFDTDSLPEGSNFEPIPEGWYTATVASADLKPTKDGSGQRINVAYDITGPTHQGRKVFGGLNIRNPSAKAEEIGRQQLGDLMRAIGLKKVEDTDQLVGGQCKIKVKLKPAQGGYEASNDVSGWKAIEGSAPPAPAPAEAPASSGAPPWAK